MDNPGVPLPAGTVVQLDPHTVGNKAFAGCFMTVSEPKDFGAQGYIQGVGADRDSPGHLYGYRANWEEMHLVGRATFVQP